jgi:glycosyltransferase involved in cell wall biosynthesis
LFWGRLEDEKGLPEIIYAIKKVSKVFKDMTLTLIGEGSRLAQYKASVANFGLKDRVDFTGWLSNREIQKLVEQSSLGLFPSRIESFGLSVVEAMAAGLPIVTASGGAIPENVKEGVTGMLVPINNADALTKAIISALENPQQAESLAKAAKTEVQKKFTWDKTADSVINLYQSDFLSYKSMI